MKRLSSHVLIVILVALTAIAMVGCGGTSAMPGGPSATTAVQNVDASRAVGMLDTRVVVDVRTAAEYAAGHIAGAQNIDVEASDFSSKISTLDKTAAYLVYCRSGRRSAIAADRMAAAGFRDIVDAGSMADLVAAGAPVE